MSLEVQRDVERHGQGRHLRVSNGCVELLIPQDYGPRILRYARCDGPNLFAEIPASEQAVPTPFGDAWHIYGGHRFWYAPEHPERTYYPDNRPVRVDVQGARVTLTQPVEAHTQLEKLLQVELHARTSHVTVLHQLTNRGTSPIELAPWALSVMAPGGTAYFPQAPFAPHPQALAPARPLVLWSFTNMSDPRWRWGERFIRLRQDATRADPQKVGMFDARGYMAYALGNQLFLKCHLPVAAPHADFGCNVETFTNELFLELETLGPYRPLAPGELVRHREDWFLFDDVEVGESEDEVGHALTRAVASAAEELRAQESDSRLAALLQKSVDDA